jgi:hypothetical protein
MEEEEVLSMWLVTNHKLQILGDIIKVMGWGLPQWWIRHKGGDELVNFDLEFFLAGKRLEQNIELVRCYIANELYTVVVQDFSL